jgi:transposase
MRKSTTNLNKKISSAQLKKMNLMAAGIDIGAQSHFVAVPEECAEKNVREFKSFTADLNDLVSWLRECQITTVAMESTGVYWIPLFELLESSGIEVKLVDARQVKNVSGRKTDVMDCQWLQELHTYGLLQGAFRPDEQICKLRAYLRQRHNLITQCSKQIQHMQKALNQMNIQLQHVLSDITGETGMKIIRAITSGERDSKVLASYRHHNCKNPKEIIEKSLEGSYREEHLFVLKQSLSIYDCFHEKIVQCEEEIENYLSTFKSKTEEELKKKKNNKTHSKNKLSFDASSYLYRITGVDLTAIPGIEASTALRVLGEIGLDVRRFKSAKQFASWLGLCPGNRISGGKRLGGKSKRTSNYAASALRMAASTLHHSKTALGAFFRRIKARLGAPKAVTATAHRLAVIIYHMLNKGEEFVEIGQNQYEQRYKERLLTSLEHRAKDLGYDLVPIKTE